MPNMPELDKRTDDMIIHRMLELASSYTPEWKPDLEHPDVGMALVSLFAQMQSGTIRRLNRTAEKNRIAFCRFLGTDLHPSEASSGYVQFGLSSDRLQDGVLLPAGTVLTAEMPEGQEENAGFTTMDDVYVSNAKPDCIIMTDGAADAIHTVYCREDDGESPSFVLFHPNGENQNQHLADIGCRSGLLYFCGAGTVQLRFAQNVSEKKTSLADALERAWLNGQLRICYAAASGWEPFSACSAQGDILCLQKNAEQPPAETMELDTVSADWIRFELKDINAVAAVEAEIQSISISVSGEAVSPDAVITKYGAAEDDWFSPFGEMPALFDALYIGSDEILTKVGAWVSMQFTVSFPPFPKQKQVEKPEGGWKLVMRKSDVQIEEQSVSWISAVSWEYFNGKGWKALPSTPELKKAFSPIDGVRSYTLEFQCPSDAVPIQIDAEECRFLRVRIMQMEQMYRPNVIYHLPLLSHIVFRYACQSFFPADRVMTENQMARKHQKNGLPMMLFSPMSQMEPALYFGLTAPLSDGPYRMLVAIEQQNGGKMPMLRWEYASESGWKALNCYDDTGQFAHTGFLTISGNHGFQKRELFRKTRYWIRVTDAVGMYQGSQSISQKPHILRMDMNCTEVRNFCKMPPVFFRLSAVTPHFTCQLPHRNICTAEVWVNELEQHSASEIQTLLQEGIADPEYDVYGVMQRLWVRWEQVEHFWASLPRDRHYQIDRTEGAVTFGDGVHGSIPYRSGGDHIRICYCVGGGSSGNVPAGAIHSSRYALGLVTKIVNPMPLYGGNDMESLSAALDRTAAEFQNGGRCVTARDYEQIALQTERSLLKVKCISGYNADGEKEPGSVTLLIMLSDFAQESAGFDLVHEKLRREIDVRRAASLAPGTCYIIHPYYIRIYVTVQVFTADSSRTFQLKEQIQRKIAEFLHPITGNFNGNGWEIGELPHRHQIENAVRSVNGVAYVKHLMMRAFVSQQQEQTELDLNHLTKLPFCLAISGTHSVQVETE